MAQTEPEGQSQTRSDLAVPALPLIERGEGCVDCGACIRHCPAHAIVFSNGEVTILRDRCVQCGACVQACGHRRFSVRDDLPTVRELLAGDRPVVAVLASEYVAAMYPLDSEQVERMLEEVGFAGVETTVLGEELVAATYEQMDAMEHHVGTPRLRSTCPVAVAWVTRFYPQLVDALIPIVPPYIAQARLVKALYRDDAAVVYISPCWARKDDCFSPEYAGAVDATIGFDELKQLFAGDGPSSPSDKRDPASSGTSPSRLRAAKELSLIDGFPRRALTDRDPTSPALVTVRGLDEIDRLLQAIVRGETAPGLVDMLCCEGCLDGPAVGGSLSVFARRNVIAADRDLQPAPPADSRALLSAMPAVELRRGFVAHPALSRVPSAEEIDAVLAAGEFASWDATIDCGACGYNTCVEHAAAICLGHSSWEQCFPLQRRLMERECEQLSRDALIDTLTGLGNRRTFDQRIAEDFSRARRHDQPLSLLMIDLDHFKEINDQNGHHSGDMVLSAVGAMLRETLRVADIACRYGGDEFAIILPETNKTEAWLVAEKIRLALQELRVESQRGDAISVRGSLGVAAFGPDHENATALLEAADAALYRAKYSGRDRVELAAG